MQCPGERPQQVECSSISSLFAPPANDLQCRVHLHLQRAVCTVHCAVYSVHCALCAVHTLHLQWCAHGNTLRFGQIVHFSFHAMCIWTAQSAHFSSALVCMWEYFETWANCSLELEHWEVFCSTLPKWIVEAGLTLNHTEPPQWGMVGRACANVWVCKYLTRKCGSVQNADIQVCESWGMIFLRHSCNGNGELRKLWIWFVSSSNRQEYETTLFRP